MVLPSTVCERPPWYVCTTLHDTADHPRLLLLVNSHSCQQTHITGHGMRVLRYTHPPQAVGAGQLAQLSTDTHHWAWYVHTTLYTTVTPKVVLVNLHCCQKTHITGHGMRVPRYTHPPPKPPPSKLLVLVNYYSCHQKPCTCSQMRRYCCVTKVFNNQD